MGSELSEWGQLGFAAVAVGALFILLKPVFVALSKRIYRNNSSDCPGPGTCAVHDACFKNIDASFKNINDRLKEIASRVDAIYSYLIKQK